ncbi:ABC transporter substrate-binding protein [Ensifer sp. ENS05]|uniref:ABC transporter substrate-binding protein n=1 Tax=Ensifer sp. ENS05 TaxID=2769277 RepID=UPI0017845B4C|nr:ABC transporter substrate-binding protein [Ensifer sp. ENS05]MBD9597294.1 ABC transporter substrate-binding protein [Ensifer sp. ENS05]
MKPITAFGALVFYAATAIVGLTVSAAATDPHKGGTLAIAFDPEPASLDPIFGVSPGKDRMIFRQVFENLFIQNVDGTLAPQLAKSWEIAADGLSITFKLREGVTFHDGVPFDAEAVKFNLDRVTDPANKARVRSAVSDIKSTEVLDPGTVRINFVAPSGVVLSGLANEAGMMSSPSAVKTKGRSYARNPVGTGPFKFVEWRGGDRLVVTRNETYWGKDEAGRPLPYLDGVETRFIANPAVKLVELRAGNVHIVDLVPAKDAEQVRALPDVELVGSNIGSAQYASFNLTKPPFDNIELRKAVALAVDRTLLDKVVSRGQGTVVPTFEPASSWAFPMDVSGHQTDIAGAKSAYEKSGHKGPITISVIQREPDSLIAQVLQSQLAAAGIQLKIDILERQAWFDKVLKYDYEMALQRATTPRADPDMSFGYYYGREAGANYAGIKNEEIFSLVEAARKATNLDERKKDYSKIQEIVLDQYYQTFFSWRANLEAVSRKVQGSSRELSGALSFEKASLVEP